MPDPPPTLDQIAAYLGQELQAALYSGEEGGVVVPRAEPLARFGLALQPTPELADWTRRERLDGLFLHRHWGYDLGQLSPSVGVVVYHKPYDAQLTTGPNAFLARELALSNVRNLGERRGEPIGMMGRVAAASFDAVAERLALIYGDLDGVSPPTTDYGSDDRDGFTVAVMSAMSDESVRLAAREGVQVYVTGQFRHPAAEAVRETGIGVIAVGHERSERWGLHVLARLIALRFPALATVVEPARS